MRIFLFHKKKNSVRHPKISDFEIEPFGNRKTIFFQNLTYCYSFLGWNAPGITKSLESFYNYFGITVKTRKNDEKFGLFDFCLWSRNNVRIIATFRKSPVNFTPKNNTINFFSTEKKKFRPASQIGRFPILRSNLRPLSGIENFFFLQFILLV